MEYLGLQTLTFDEKFKVLIPFALILIPLFLSLFVGIMTLIIGPYLKLDYPSLFLFCASFAFRLFKSYCAFRFSMEFMGL